MKIESITRKFDLINKSLFRSDSELDYDDTIEAITELANMIDDYDGETEKIWYIGDGSECDMVSLLVGAYWYASDWHGGQYSDEYAMLSAIGSVYRPGMACLEDEGAERDVYNALEVKNPDCERVEF